MKRFVLLLLAGVFLLGCTQPGTPPTPDGNPPIVPSNNNAFIVPSVMPSASLTPSLQSVDYYDGLEETCAIRAVEDTLLDGGECCKKSVELMRDAGLRSPTNGVCPEGFVVQSMKCPGAFSSCHPVPSVSPSPTLAVVPASANDLAVLVAPVVNAFFNASAKVVKEDAGRFVVHEKQKEFEFSVVVTNASRHWIVDDTRRNFTSNSNITNGALVFEGITLKQNGFLLGGSQFTPRYYGYFATMKCYGQKFDVQLNLVDYVEFQPDLFRRDVGPNAMRALVDVCPA